MIGVDTLDGHVGADRQSRERELKTAFFPLPIGIDEVPDRDHESAGLRASDQYVIRGIGQAFLPKLVQQLEGVIAWFVDAALGAQTEMAFERLCYRTAFFEHIRKRPERHHVN